MGNDTFHILAPYYDAIMTRVRYDKWENNLLLLSQLLDLEGSKIKYLDVACGTGVLIQRLSRYGWDSIGVDISPSMLGIAVRNCSKASFILADMRHLPFSPKFTLLSSLFDSINFLLEDEDIFKAMSSMKSVLAPGGLIYFDCVTEQMVKLYYKEKEWRENYKDFDTLWRSSYNEKSKIATLSILVKGVGWTNVYQRIHPIELFKDAIKSAGLTLLACLDAHTWNEIDSRTVRVDFVCANQPSDTIFEKFTQIKNYIALTDFQLGE
ncbi:MAG: class I SAM-dependent methyltransferase [Candidatus Hydrogenedentes bacterium]|nr:class I SAM-dependent methyltransferase [Candidatus Hydrogenedentota bacterium]